MFFFGGGGDMCCIDPMPVPRSQQPRSRPPEEKPPPGTDVTGFTVSLATYCHGSLPWTQEPRPHSCGPVWQSQWAESPASGQCGLEKG